MIEVHEKIPEGFIANVETSACYIEVQGKLLLLQLGPEKAEHGRWGVPAGKFEKNETPAEAATRELFEETGIVLAVPPLTFFGTLYVRKPTVSYTYHMFKVLLDHFPEVTLSSEHINYTWASAKDLETLPLMAGAHDALKIYFQDAKKLGLFRTEMNRAV